MTSNKPIANWTIDALVNWGVRTIICSPGSRNAPLVISALDHPSIEVVTVLDERSAAFIALGYLQQQNLPVAVCCTSGSALANYHPAVLEAFHSKLPLIVVSADRPADRIFKGEGQTCFQPNFYQPHIGASVHWDESSSLASIKEDVLTLSKTLAQHLPVHVNCALDEPLYETAASSPEVEWITAPQTASIQVDWEAIRGTISSNGPAAIVVGQLTPKQSEALRALLSQSDWNLTFFADPTSGLLDHPHARPLKAIVNFTPQTVLSIGGQWIDKKPKFHLRSLPLNTHIHLDPFQAWEVTDAPEFLHIKAHVAALSNLKEALEEVAISAPSTTLETAALPWSDAAVAQRVFSLMQPEHTLHLGNSTAVRYFGFFPTHVKVHSNRGVAGIDGSLSTAVGAALADPDHIHWCVLGDQSFIYDSNALQLQYLPKNLTIVVLNNGVGAIFDWLPGVQKTDPQAQAVFANPLKVSIKGLVEASGADYVQVDHLDALSAALVAKGRCKVIDAQTHDAPNTAVAQQFLRG